MTDDQQGFICDSKTELVELNHLPLYSPSLPPLPNNLRPPRLSLPLQQLHHHHASSSFPPHHEHKLIYSCQSRRAPPLQNELVFESSFEGGNLEYVTLQGSQYHLFMRADTNTRGHFQWFYFRVRNRQKKKVHFVIKNFNKSHMLYNQGLTPFAKSYKSGKSHKQIKTSARYQEEFDEDQNVRYSLKFDYHFQYQNDEVEFCSQPPYTYQTLKNYLDQRQQFKTLQLATTVMGHPISALLLNDPKNSKALIVVIARQHPGQSVGSWMMQGYVSRLASLVESESQRCRDICWIIVPMINIDGVMLGNNRTGLLGYDFNRCWNCDEDSFKQSLFPQLIGILKYFKKTKRQRNKTVKMFLDLHGHSSQPNVFTYGPPLPQQSEHFDVSRLFPYLMSKKHPAFSLDQCSYQITSQKRYCSRSIFFSKLGFPYSYTVESSFGIYQGKQIDEGDMMGMGKSLCECSLDLVYGLIHEKEELSLSQRIAEMKKECGEEMASHAREYDSDSDGDQPIPSCSLNFQMKSLFKREKKNKLKGISRKNTQPQPESSQYMRISGCINTQEPAFTRKNRKMERYRFKTDCSRETKGYTGRKEQIRFPYLSHKKLPPEESIQKRHSLVNSVKKVKPSQKGCSLFKNEMFKIGKGVFILNGYQK